MVSTKNFIEAEVGGLPLAAVTVAVKATLWPKADGVGDAEIITVVVTAGATFWNTTAEGWAVICGVGVARKLALPRKSACTWYGVTSDAVSDEIVRVYVALFAVVAVRVTVP